MILNLNGILFAIQVVLLLFVGPYADYGNWRGHFLLGTSLTMQCITHLPKCRG